MKAREMPETEAYLLRKVGDVQDPFLNIICGDNILSTPVVSISTTIFLLLLLLLLFLLLLSPTLLLLVAYGNLDYGSTSQTLPRSPNILTPSFPPMMGVIRSTTVVPAVNGKG